MSQINLNFLIKITKKLNHFRNSRTRRPDRAFYIPKAKRSQTTPPSASSTSTKSHQNRSKTKLKSKSIDSPSSSNSEEANEENEEGYITVINSPSQTANNSCDLTSNYSTEEDGLLVDTKSQKNSQNLIAMSQQQQRKDLIIENGSIAAGGAVDKVDKDEKELMKASQEINRSNRKLIKQSFNSNILQIENNENAVGSSGIEAKNKVETVNNDEDDWDTL